MLHILTPHGNHYVVNDKGYITQYGNRTFSGKWALLGIARVNAPGSIVYTFKQLTPEVLRGLTVRYKNGNPRYTVVDLDHGTRRSWGNTKYHGIGYIWAE